jgi:CRP-like cAMP-binding protein
VASKIDMKAINIKNLPPEKVQALLAIGRRETLSAGTYFLREGEIPRRFAYVNKGLFRYVYIDDKGYEFTKGIIQEQRFISSYSAMVTESPSFFFIEALEEAEVISFSFPQWKELADEDPSWTKFLLQLVEKGFMAKEKRERELLLLDAEARYRNFLYEFPGLEKRIKQTIIASYLGIQPESLSRIRKKLLT